MNQKRQINGTKYNVSEIVTDAIAAVDKMTLDTERARQSLKFMGHTNPTDELVNRYARESAILKELEKATGANFSNQIGKIDFSNVETTIENVNSYLNRRINGQHQRYSQNYGRR